jgi:hypothetical protein
MFNPKQSSFNDRLSSAAEAKKAMLAKFKPKPMIKAEGVVDSAAEKEARLKAIREQRAAEKEAARLAAEAAEKARVEALLNDEQHQLELARQARKERKALAKAEARAKREAKSAARRG